MKSYWHFHTYGARKQKIEVPNCFTSIDNLYLRNKTVLNRASYIKPVVTLEEILSHVNLWLQYFITILRP